MPKRRPVFFFQSFFADVQKLLVCLCLAGLMTAHAIPVKAADEDTSIDLRLFGQNVIEGYNGCHLAFWQANKNPDTEKYAYVFYAPFNDGQELPAWMKIGKTVFEFQRQDKVTSDGQALEPLRLYRTSKGTYTALLEVIAQHSSGGSIVVDKAKLTIIQAKHFPFVISVKGGIYCPEQPQEKQSGNSETIQVDPPFGDPVPLGKPVEFDSLDTVPRGVINAIKRDAPECNMEQTTGVGSRYAISDTVTLWEVPCNLYPRTGSATYVVSMNGNSEYSTVLPFPSLPGIDARESNHEIRNPQMDTVNGIVSSEYYDGDGSCGSYESYQLRSVEGEALEFFLMEYREKPNCDGAQTSARQFPLVYTAR